jgi:hypothetical protein
MLHTTNGKNKHIIEYECQCKSCGGTGLYVGMAERNGAAVLCINCKGTGREVNRITYTEFDKRKKRSGVTRVYKCNPGICINDDPKFGGMPFSDWHKGHEFPPGHEMRNYTCPTWYYQTADYNKKPNWKECEILGSFSECKNFCNKHKCWAKWDKQYAT